MIIAQAFRHVFGKPAFILFSVISGCLMFLFSLWIPSIPMIIDITGHEVIPLSQKLHLPLYLIGLNFTALAPLAAFFLIIISVLFGINLSMIVYLLQHRIAGIQKNGIMTGFFGVSSGLLGTGCAACGSVFLTSVFPFFGISGITALLPLGGEELRLLGIVLFIFSIYLVAKQIQNPAACKI